MNIKGRKGNLFLLFLVSLSSSQNDDIKTGLQIKEGSNVSMSCQEQNTRCNQGSDVTCITKWRFIGKDGFICDRAYGVTDTNKSCFVPGGPYTSRTSYEGSGAVHIKNVKMEETGIYRCECECKGSVVDSREYYGVIIVPEPTVPPSTTSNSPVIENTEARLTCHWIPFLNETITYIWTRNNGNTDVLGRMEDDVYVVEINDFNRNEAGDYTCSITTAGGSISTTEHLVVHYPPAGDPSITKMNPSSNLLYEGDSLTITCSIEGGFPTANLTWSCPGLISNDNFKNSTISKRSVSGKVPRILDREHCTCTASQRAWLPSGTTKSVQTPVFIVYFPPGIPTLTTKDIWLENKTETAECTASAGNPENNYFWILIGKVYETRTNARLEVPATKDYNDVMLYCNVTNNFTITKNDKLFDSRLLNVEYSPRLQPIQAQTIMEGDSLTMYCTAKSNPQSTAADYTWTDTKGNEHQIQNLTIDAANKTHTGQYTCTVSVDSRGNHGTLTGHTTTRITVQYLHLSALPSFDITEKETLTIVCNSEGEPTPTFTPWRHTGEFIRDRSFKGTTDGGRNTLTINNVSYIETGSYSCNSNNSAYQKQTTTTVTVRYSPLSLTYGSSSSIVATKVGETAILNITVRAHPEDVTFTWEFGGEDKSWTTIDTNNTSTGYNQTDIGLTSYLYIASFQPNHAGFYKVYGKNNVSVGREYEFEIRPHSFPEKPRIQDSDTHVTAISVTLVWISGFNGGSTQTFTVEYRKQGDTDYTSDEETVSDPGYQNTASKFISNLTEQTNYEFRVKAKNTFPEFDATYSDVVSLRTKELPQLSNKERFTVRYEVDNAILEWPPPTGKYTRQIIEQRMNKGRKKRAIPRSSECLPPDCSEHDVDVNKHTITIPGSSRSDTFILVLYDRDVQVARFTAIPQSVPLSTPFPVVAVVVPIILVVLIIPAVLGFLFYRRRNQHKSVKRSKQGNTNLAYADPENPTGAHGAPYADIESPNVPSVLGAATTEELNPLYGAANYGDENANDIQPYAEVGHKPIIAKKPKQPLEGPVVYAEVNKKKNKNNDGEGPVLYAEVTKKKDKGKKSKEEEDGPVLYAEVNKKKGKGKKTDDGEGPVLYAEVNKKKDKGKKGKEEEEGPVLYAEVNKKKGKGKKGKEEEEGPVLYAEVNKKKGKGKKTDDGEGPVLYAEVNKKKDKGKKSKEDVKDVYAEVDKKKNKKDKKKGKKDKTIEPEEGAYELCEKTNKGVAAVNYPPPPEDHTYGNVVTDGEQTKPPPGSDGLVYAEVQIVKPPPRKPKPSSLKKQQEDEERTMYADIDLTKKAAPLPPDEPPPPPAGPPPE